LRQGRPLVEAGGVTDEVTADARRVRVVLDLAACVAMSTQMILKSSATSASSPDTPRLADDDGQASPVDEAAGVDVQHRHRHSFIMSSCRVSRQRAFVLVNGWGVGGSNPEPTD
jgi:hypothetical protein